MHVQWDVDVFFVQNNIQYINPQLPVHVLIKLEGFLWEYYEDYLAIGMHNGGLCTVHNYYDYLRGRTVVKVVIDNFTNFRYISPNQTK